MNEKSPLKTLGGAQFLGGIFLFRIFKFLASLRLAIATLLSLIGVLAAGTILESRVNSEAAKILVYNAAWFGVLLIVLGLNLACSALDRLPWKKKHIGFLLTHLGIITILAGSLMTQSSAIDGQISLQEGASGKWATLKSPVLYVYAPGFKEERMIPLRAKAFKWSGREKITEFKSDKKKIAVSMLRYYPKARAETKWIAAPKGPAALQVTLHNSFMNVTQWVADDDANREIQMGPAVMRIASAAELAAAKPVKDQASYLEFQTQGVTAKLDLPAKAALPFQATLENGVSVKVLELYTHAFVDKNVLKEGLAAEHAENPAAVLELAQDGQSEKHTVFANFPDFPTVHGRPESRFGFKVIYHRPAAEATGPKNELRFIPRAYGFDYQVKKGADIKQGKVEPGKEIKTGWMDIQFRVDQVLKNATTDWSVEAMPEADPTEGLVSAAELEIKSDKETRTFWAVEGLSKTLMIEDALFEFIFGRRQIPLGFELQLKKFRVKNDPGTDRAAAYESDVALKDFTRGTSIEKTISMNQPLVYRGIRLYQAGFEPAAPGSPQTSVFAVGSDPGIPVKYAGAIIMVIGILLMFYTRAYSTTNERGIE